MYLIKSMGLLFKISRFIVGLYFFVYVLVHILLLILPYAFVNHAVFMNLINFPFSKLKNPSAYRLNKVHNFYLETEPGIKVGVWHYIPDALQYDFKQSKSSLNDHFETYFGKSDDRPVILYAHGNGGDRAVGHRRLLCSKLRDIGYHVFAIDYRGYGDSTGYPSEKGAVFDLMFLFNYIKSYQSMSKIFIWGHSLGTGISSHAAKILSELDSAPAGIVLEAPFVNISKAAKEYIYAPLFLNNPWIINKVDETLEALDLRLNTDKNILEINSKILLLHAEDDWLIPLSHSQELMRISTNRKAFYPSVRLIDYAKELNLGHNNIHNHLKLYFDIKEFIEEDEENQSLILY